MAILKESTMARITRVYVIVSQLVPDELLHHEDRDDAPLGVYSYPTDDIEQALDEFHDDYAIARLDDFDIAPVRVIHARRPA
jgi:hypothetical protein